jgi:hypothetical protein
MLKSALEAGCVLIEPKPCSHSLFCRIMFSLTSFHPRIESEDMFKRIML